MSKAENVEWRLNDGGMLTAWCQEEDRIVQIPSRDRGGPVRDVEARRWEGNR